MSIYCCYASDVLIFICELFNIVGVVVMFLLYPVVNNDDISIIVLYMYLKLIIIIYVSNKNSIIHTLVNYSYFKFWQLFNEYVMIFYIILRKFYTFF